MEIHCEICQKEFSGVSTLAPHLKTHRAAPKKYFEQHFPRQDLSNKKKIEFKSLEQYFLSDFVDKTSMKSWMSKVGSERATAYVVSKLRKYCEIKKLKSAPPEYFIQTMGCLPSIRFIEKLCDKGYSEICSLAGLATQFDYTNLSDRLEKKKVVKQIVIDTREKRPLKFSSDLKRISIGLSYGDYALSPASKIAVERKSNGDFFGTLGAGLERFEREIKRAEDNDGYVIIMVESAYSSLAYTKGRWAHANPEYIFHRMRDLYKKFSCFQVVFCDGRVHMKDLVIKFLSLGDEVKKLDLQHCIDKDLI